MSPGVMIRATRNTDTSPLSEHRQHLKKSAKSKELEEDFTVSCPLKLVSKDGPKPNTEVVKSSQVWCESTELTIHESACTV